MTQHTDNTGNSVLYQHLAVLAKCYSTGCFEELFPLLAEDAVMESQWVLRPNVGKRAVMDYYIRKGRNLRNNHCCPSCRVVRLVGGIHPVENAELNVNGEDTVGSVALPYADGSCAMLMCQTPDDVTNGVIVLVTPDENDMIARIDLCMPELFRFEIVDEAGSRG